MDNRQRVNAIMHYEKYDRMPVVAFGYWQETLQKWHEEGHVSADEARYYADNNEHDLAVMSRLGFDFNWNGGVGGNSHLMPYFENKVLSVEPDGSVISRDNAGLIVKTKPGVVSIPAHVGTSLTGREAWEEMYLPKLTYSDARVDADAIRKAYEDNAKTGRPQYIHIGSLYGNIRNMLGVEELAYLQADDEDLYVEIINTVGELNYKVAEKVLSLGLEFDYAHFWEDICFKSGPLVRPSVFAEYVGPWYKKITELLKKHGVDIVSVDCDGLIDKLVPIWLENGVNTMFPIEVGTWNASFDKWRKQYGTELRGVGGMDKRVFSQDYAAVDREIERLKPLVDLGGYIPCPDHRIAPDAKWENVQYYCEKFRKVFG
ncbi:MAG: hypothetical protein IIX93_02980 [Clostridia bacterium]|nr:hypothetical protein [Clostridia bacterium]